MRTIVVLALLVALIAPASAQSIMHFRSNAVGRAATLEGYLYQPSGGGRHPAVVFMHGCTGLLQNGNPDARSMQWERVLTKMGFVVLMVDSFTGRGVQNMCEPAKFDERIYTARPFDAIAALQYLQAQSFVDPSRIGIVGWSQGGGTVLTLVSDDALRSRNGFKAAVAIYPDRCNGMMIDRQEWSTMMPLLVVLGGRDNWTPSAPCMTALQNEPEVQFKVYPNAYHDFDWPNKRMQQLPLYRTTAVIPTVGEDPAARKDALKFVSAFLQRNLGS